jgi:hypothetical protein
LNNKVYEFAVAGEKGNYKVTFEIKGDILHVLCTCGRSTGTEYACRHARQVLEQKNEKITGGDLARQQELLASINAIEEEKTPGHNGSFVKTAAAGAATALTS